jgi:hypothetical protein
MVLRGRGNAQILLLYPGMCVAIFWCPAFSFTLEKSEESRGFFLSLVRNDDYGVGERRIVS